MGKFLALLGVLLFGSFAYAQSDDLAFLSQVLNYIDQFGGLKWMGQVAGGIAIIISSMKVSFLHKLWDKVGSFKAYVAPVLGLIAGVLSLGVNPEQEISWAAVMAYVTAGAGALIVHELLDAVKAIPGLGKIWVSVIDFLKIILKGPAPQSMKK